MVIKDIKIDIGEAVRYMGYRNVPDEGQMALIRQRAEHIEKNIKPAAIYQVFDIEETVSGIRLKMTNITLAGEDIRRHLAGCEKCILLCATAGIKADELIRRAQVEDISAGFMTDCLASAAVEAVCNELEVMLKDMLKEWHFTWRFSPGYGDLPLSVQPQIIDVLDAPKRAGVSCLESLLMVPAKSVTAIIGLSREPVEEKRRGCAVCNMSGRCDFRKRGIHC
jgi:5-methyltetrahydrofolate--homocysteine methyltransferase